MFVRCAHDVCSLSLAMFVGFADDVCLRRKDIEITSK